MDEPNFSAYQSGRSFRYLGGWAKVSPVDLVAPHGGRWHVVLDLGGASGSIQHSLEVIRNN